MKYPFIGPSFLGKSTNVNAQRCVNLYPQIDNGEAKNVIALYGTPGMTKKVALATTGKVRGMIQVDDYLYAVCDNTFYVIDSDYNATAKSTSISGTGQVSMAENTLNIFIATGGADAYLYDLTTGLLTQITDPDFEGAGIVVFQDGYFMWNVPDTQKFQIAGPYTTAIEALDFASAESDPDDLVAIHSMRKQVWLIGNRSSEVWYNSGASAFPFERIPGSLSQVGTNAPYSVASINNAIFWLANDRTVRMATEYAPNIISPNTLVYQISRYSTVDDAFGYCSSWEGHNFYHLTFPTEDVTWVYDQMTNMWHQRKAYAQGRHRSNCYAVFNGDHIVGDYMSGDLLKLDSSVYEDDGQPIERIRASQYVHSEENKLFMRSFRVDFEEGVGLLGTVQGETPQAMLRYSDDGGHTWSREKWISIGQLGQYSKRVKWRRLGMFRSRIMEVTITDPVKVVMIGAYAEIVGGRE